jgi:hypothetical protein
MTKTVYPPNRTDKHRNPCMIDVFMAGSIEMGLAEDWQPIATAAIEDLEPVHRILNPRRADWDSTQAQRVDNPYFAEQVNWELDHIEQADVVYMYFDPNTKSPISMVEVGYILGMRREIKSRSPHLRATPLVIYCPDDFWRSGNMAVMCDRAGITVHTDFTESIKALKMEIWRKHILKSNMFGYYPFQSPYESQSDIKKLSAFERGTKRVYS